jgi:hypothetical protein
MKKKNKADLPESSSPIMPTCDSLIMRFPSSRVFFRYEFAYDL